VLDLSVSLIFDASCALPLIVYCHERSRLIGTLGVVMTQFWMWVVHVGNKNFATSVALCRTPSPQFLQKKNAITIKHDVRLRTIYQSPIYCYQQPLLS
jgi:hypothetical protein